MTLAAATMSGTVMGLMSMVDRLPRFESDLGRWMRSREVDLPWRALPRLQEGMKGRYFVGKCPACGDETYFVELESGGGAEKGECGSQGPAGADFGVMCEECGAVGTCGAQKGPSWAGERVARLVMM